MSDDQALKATLSSYYETIASHEFDAIPKYFTPSMTIVTLSGRQNVTGSQEISGLYGSLWTTRSSRGTSTEMGFFPEQFVVLPVQANCNLVKTQLTNYDFDGNQLQSWNCTYVMVKEGNNWLINLATSDNQASSQWQ